MSVIDDAIRQFWIPGLNSISGKTEDGFADWVIKQGYQIFTSIQKDECTLEVSDEKNLLMAFAFDCNRMAVAAFESMHLINRSELLPRSTAWLIIQSYYAAFFAAHSILRILGISCSQLEKKQTNKIDEIAKLFGVDNGIQLSKGYYYCLYDHNDKKITCKNLKSSSGGTHEAFWDVFCKEMNKLSNSLLSSDQIPVQSQSVAAQLDEMCRILCHEGKNGGNWLSYVRNTVNYKHELGSWFPYKNISKTLIADLYGNHNTWLDDPMRISLVLRPGTDIRLFHRTCNFIVGLCRILVEDMANRCPKGKAKSYLADGSMRLLNID